MLITCTRCQRESVSAAKTFFEALGLSERVVGGRPVAGGMFPWVVYIQANHKYKNNTQTSNLCGGSLIHERYIMVEFLLREAKISIYLVFSVFYGKGSVFILKLVKLMGHIQYYTKRHFVHSAKVLLHVARPLELSIIRVFSRTALFCCVVTKCWAK